MTTITETVPSLGTVPTTADPANFDTNADTLLGTALPAAITSMNTAFGQLNTVSGEVNTNAATASSGALSAAASAASAVAIAAYAGAWASQTGAKTVPYSVDHAGAFWILLSNVADVTAEEPGVSASWARAYDNGQIYERASNTQLVAEDNGKVIKITSGTFSQTFEACANLGSNWSITIVNDGTGVITLDPDGAELIDSASTKTLRTGNAAFISCSGTALTTIVFASPAGDHSVVVTTANGHGSTNNKIRIYTVLQSSSGTAITRATSAADGDSFTINTNGLYAITLTDGKTSTGGDFGISLNSAQLTTAVGSITAADRLLYTNSLAGNLHNTVSGVFALSTGDVIRVHTAGTMDSTAVESSVLRIRRVGIV